MHGEYILCAAIWFKKNSTIPHQPKNIEFGLVVAGRRHHNCFATVMGLLPAPLRFEHIQGFLTNTDRFVDRIEGRKIAFNAGQVKDSEGQLFSEDLY